MEAAAGDSLSAVRRKASDIQYHSKLLSAMKELREHRRWTSRKKGILSS